MMLGNITQAQNIYIACGYTDMRKSIDGLAAIVQQQFQLDPFSRNLLEEDGQLNLFNEIEVEGDPTRKEKDPIQVSRNKVKVRQPKTRREVVPTGYRKKKSSWNSGKRSQLHTVRQQAETHWQEGRPGSAAIYPGQPEDNPVCTDKL